MRRCLLSLLLLAFALFLSMAVGGCAGGAETFSGEDGSVGDDGGGSVTDGPAGGGDGAHKDATGGEGGAPPGKVTIGGTISGLSGKVVLQDNGGDDLTVKADGSFTFKTALGEGAEYAVTVLTQPASPSQVCMVTDGSGDATGDVTSVVVTCTTNTFTIGGTVSGLSGMGLVLTDNGGDDLPIAADGPFTFLTAVDSGAPYVVKVGTPPGTPTQDCVVTAGSGTVADANVTDVVVACTISTFTIGGMISGLDSGDSVVLQDNGGDNLTVSANGAFTFATPVASGAMYAATVLTQPSSPAQVCGITAGSGMVTSADVTSIVVTCADAGSTTDVSFPTTTSTCAGQSPGPLGSGGTSEYRWESGDSVSQAYARTTSSVELILDFQMSDSTEGCGAGVTLDWNVELNGTVVGSFSWLSASASTHTVSETYTYTAIAPVSGEFTIEVIATSTVCVGGGSWDWIPGGTATIE
jgi:hypothetical protein